MILPSSTLARRSLLWAAQTAFCVRDMDKSLAFYQEVLGFQVLTDRRQETTADGLPYAYKHRRATRRQVTLAYGEGDAHPQLVMTEHPGEPPDGEPIKLDRSVSAMYPSPCPYFPHLPHNFLAKAFQPFAPPDAFQDQSGRVLTVFFFFPVCLFGLLKEMKGK